MPGAGRKPNAVPTEPRLVRLTDDQHAMLKALGGSPWLQGLLILPSQDGRQLRLLNPAADWTELKAVALPGRTILTVAASDAAALGILLDGGQVVLVGPATRTATRT